VTRVPADVYEAAVALVDARGRRCAACEPGNVLVVHRSDPPCEEHAWQVLRQRLAENRPIPGEDEGAAQWRIVRNLFNDVARAAAAETFEETARFTDLPPSMQRVCTSGIYGLLMQFAQMARHHAGRRQ